MVLRVKLKELKEQGAKRIFSGTDKHIVRVIAVVMSLYQLAQAFLTVQPMLHHSLHLTFILVLATFLYTPFASSDRTRIPTRDYVIAGVALATGIYFFIAWRGITRWPQVDPLTTPGIIIGITILVLIFCQQGAARVYSSLIGLIFLSYAFRPSASRHTLPQALPIDI